MTWPERLEETGIATAVREGLWLYPAVETLHILGLGLLIGAAALWDLRLLGLARRFAVTDLAGFLLPAARTGFALATASGFLLFAATATAMVTNPAFQAKLALIVVALANITFFHLRTYRTVAAWDRMAPPSPAARSAAVVSLLVWTAVVASGRLIAYL